MSVTNTYRTDIGLPDGTVLRPGVATLVHNWETLRKNAVVQAWIKAGILVETADGAARPDKDDDDIGSTKPKLIAKLEALGQKVDKRKSIDQLKDALAAAEAAAAETDAESKDESQGEEQA